MRAVYLLFIILIIIFTLPLMLVLSLAVAVLSGFPVFFRQVRIGKGGKPFVLYKFRTMIRGADSLKAKYKKLNIASGPAFKIPDDPRFTPIGRFLSRTGLDELPQLFNVLQGEMALIGPRPLPVDEAGRLSIWQREREKIKPGIISPWILNGYHTNTFDAWMKSDIAYIRKKNLYFDFRLTLRTVKFLSLLLMREISARFK